ncbi:MAG: Gfo/Idh/MocA family oxidoreductase, partial [Rhodospirillaceae bacterium]|nr:Gfo/Idh/MocA family oxidoreductase [Rhodospirillaceae bacterium]
MEDGEGKGPLRLGMVGGGLGSFIGPVHRTAAAMTGRYRLVAGALGSTAESSRAAGRAAGLAPDRVYDDVRRMAEAEAGRPDGVEVVAVVTPNVAHHPACAAFLEAGIDVICDKPLTATLAEAQDLADRVARSGRFLGVTYNYTAYPMVREARALVEAGALGPIRLVHVEFLLGWMATPVEAESRQAAWRADPARSGPSLVTADLGTHCLHLAEFVSRRRVTELCADLNTFVPGRRLEDDARALLRFDNGARGHLWVSMVAAGETVGLRLRVYGEKGHIAWEQHRPDELRLALDGEGARTLVRGMGGLSAPARRASRLVPGLPEGFLEAFANLYADYAEILE